MLEYEPLPGLISLEFVELSAETPIHIGLKWFDFDFYLELDDIGSSRNVRMKHLKTA